MNDFLSTYTIENKDFVATIAAKGAELIGLISKSDSREWMWRGYTAEWNNSACLLFPICGRTNDKIWTYEGKVYPTHQHGFLYGASPAEVIRHGRDAVEMIFCETEETMTMFPFPFEVRVLWQMTEDGVAAKITIRNTGKKDFAFSFGWHPSFRLPLKVGKTLADHSFRFPEAGEIKQMEITENHLYGGPDKDRPYPLDDNTLPLCEEQFAIDGIFLKGVGSVYELHCKGADRYLSVRSAAATAFGCWKEMGAEFDYMCVEPWMGAPAVDGVPDDLMNKCGATRLAAGDSFVFDCAVGIHNEKKN